jgi:hypothetical protein
VTRSLCSEGRGGLQLSGLVLAFGCTVGDGVYVLSEGGL